MIRQEKNPSVHDEQGILSGLHSPSKMFDVLVKKVKIREQFNDN